MSLAVMLPVILENARAQTSSASRPLSATVISTHVVRNGALTLLVLWRGSPGWYARGGSGSSSGGGGGSAGVEVGSFSLMYGGRTFSVDLNYTTRVATLLKQEISLADTNVVLVDEVDGPSGGQVVGRHWVDPRLPAAAAPNVRTIENDPVIIAIRRGPEIWPFLQCDVPVPIPSGSDSAAGDPTARLRSSEYVQGVLTRICRAATSP